MGPVVAASAAALLLASAVAGLDDASTLVQGLAHARHRAAGGAGDSPRGPALQETERGPLVQTEAGPVLGASRTGHYFFAGIPYADPPERFARAVPRTPWGPEPLDATKFHGICIGADSFVKEDEDCLRLNVYTPKGGRHGLPVVVYFHGGVNQHSSGAEPLRQGDQIVQSAQHPIVFVSFDFRLGIFGWIDTEEDVGAPKNIGFTDQQLALRWIQRNIAAFGGDPSRVTLLGHSEGSGAILTHLVAPGSEGLFQRCAMVSPPADLWSRSSSRDHTLFVARRAGCLRKGRDMLQCLKGIKPHRLWNKDWNTFKLGHVAALDFPQNLQAFLEFMAVDQKGNSTRAIADNGWHAVVDSETVPGEPRKLISEGKWHKVPVLMTSTMNESLGSMPEIPFLSPDLGVWLSLKEGDGKDVRRRYLESFNKTGVPAPKGAELMHAMFTDKIWMCDMRSLARDMRRSGGDVRLGFFQHTAQASVSALTNRLCAMGRRKRVACHADDMFYLLPQGRLIHVDPKDKKEVEFVRRYMEEFLAFVYGETVAWAPFAEREEVTLFDTDGPWVQPHFRKEQCDVLDSSMGEGLPEFMRLHAREQLSASSAELADSRGDLP